jgi:hypothetical protein
MSRVGFLRKVSVFGPLVKRCCWWSQGTHGQLGMVNYMRYRRATVRWSKVRRCWKDQQDEALPSPAHFDYAGTPQLGPTVQEEHSLRHPVSRQHGQKDGQNKGHPLEGAPKLLKNGAP